MKIGFVRVFVSDLARALDFYSNKLGMELDYTDKSHWAQFKSGEDVSLAIESCPPERAEHGGKLVGRFVGVTLVVDNISETYERLKARGVEFTGLPEKQAWGATMVHLKDLDENVLSLMEPSHFDSSLYPMP